MQHTEDNELVPLKAGFDVTWRGYDRAQVAQHLEDVADEIRLIAADRNAALSQVDDLTSSLEKARSETDTARAEVDRLCRAPVSAGELSARLQRMLELANAEGTEIVARAQAAAEHTWTSAQEAATALKFRYERLLTDLEEQRKAMIAEHRSVMAKARAHVDQMTRQAEARCQTLDTKAEKRRAAIEADFRISIDDRRRKANQEIDDERAWSKATAEKQVSDATAKAQRLVSEATAKAERLVSEATAKSDRIVTEATNKSETMVNDATAESERRLGKASEEADSRVSEASIKAERMVTDANTEADRTLGEANEQVEQLRRLRDQLNNQLSSALDLMRDAAPLLHDADAEDDQQPVQAEPESNGHDQQVPGQLRHSAVPPSKAKGATSPRLTVNIGPSRGSE